MNPYGFVRFGPPGRKEQALGHDRFKGHSGILHCRLTARTHLFIPQTQQEANRAHQELRMMRLSNGMPLLPGSSLKGVLRSVAEAVSGSCLTLPPTREGQVEYRDRPPIKYRVPEGFEHCRGNENGSCRLCPACRLFGSLSGGNAFLGKIGINDAVAIGDASTERLTIEALMEPKPRHGAWYGDPQRDGYMRGRKFYHHRSLGPRTTVQRTQYNKTIEAIRPGTVFDFKVDYTNLTDDELALLVFALVLEPDMCHKAGMGKPVGLGSAKIEAMAWTQIDRDARYEQLAGGESRLEGGALAGEITRWQRHYHETYLNWQDSLSDLRRIWIWDPINEKDVRYPLREWFRLNPRTPLEQAP